MAATAELLGRAAQANESSSIRRRWFVRGATDEADAIATVVAATPSAIGGQVLKTVAIEEEVLGGFRCEANYGMFKAKEPPQTGESQFNFEINTQPQRVYAPIGSVTTYGTDMPQIDLIGEQLDGRPPEGADIFLPTHSESETHYLQSSAITAAYKQQIKQLVGRTNNALWKGHSPGEALVSAVSGSKRGADDWEVTFRWLVRENQSNITVGTISGITMQGWQHGWPLYKLDDDPGGEAYLTNIIIGFAVATIFREGNMFQLGIGS